MFPWSGLVIYAVLGRLRLPKRRVELQAKVSDLIREARGRWEQHTTQLSHDLCPEVRR